MQKSYSHDQNIKESLKSGFVGGILGIFSGMYSGFTSLPPNTPIVMAIPKSLRPMIRYSFSLSTTLFLYTLISNEYVYYVLQQNKDKNTFEYLATQVPTWKQVIGNGLAGGVSGLVFSLTNFDAQRRSVATSLSTAATFGLLGLSLKYYFVNSYQKAYKQYQQEQFLERKEFEDKNLQQQIEDLEKKLNVKKD